MRVHVAKLESRFPSPWELYSLVVLVGAAIYVPLSYLADAHFLHSPMRYTGLACPLCGGTRAVTALCSGQFLLAVKYNPLALVIFAMFVWATVSYFFMVIPFKRRVEVEANKAQISVFWVVVGIALIANWGYVLWAGMYERELANPFV